MAAHAAVDTGQEGEGVADKPESNIDIIAWLKSNRLGKIIGYVEENELVIDDVLTWTKEDIELIYIL